MNGVSRFLSRRDKNHEKHKSKHTRNKSSKAPPPDLYTIFSNVDSKSSEKEEEKKKVKTLLQRLQAAGISNLGEPQVEYALAYYPNDLDQAFDLLQLADDSFNGILKDFDPKVTMLGAINRNMVTCYLDALLFAMFARLDSFEAMLFDNFADEPRKKLAAVLRLWVNLLRTGRLIGVELTKHLQESLGNCGWEEAMEVCQQDASEAFTFITGALELPLLTLKMDIYHTGREDKEDDHKFVNERLLEVAIPEQEDDSDQVLTLEHCLENYFNNRIEVKRYLRRQNTVSSIRPSQQEQDSGKGQTIHIESVEIPESSTPIATTPTTPATPLSPIRPGIDGRRRADSIFSERYVRRQASSDQRAFDEKKLLDEMLNTSSAGRPRAASFRKEVMMPAWQFFSLIPWYTDNVPKTDAQVAAHFSAKRPVLGICLKRYSMLPNGAPKRLDTFVDIPLEIGLPHFVSDDHMQEDGPLFGNFKLVLQSVVCHRGVSVDSGHYVALVRANLPSHAPRTEGALDSWMLFDDLAPQRITDTDIKEALRKESPYLLFYQVQPIDEELANRGDPPSYAASTTTGLPSVDPSRETLLSDTTGTDTEVGDHSERVYSNESKSEEPGGRSSMSSTRRVSLTLEGLENESIQSLSRGRTAPTTPEDPKPGFLSASRRNSNLWMGGSKSRPGSQSGEGRLSLTISRLTGRASKDKLAITSDGGAAASEDPVIVINEVQGAETPLEGPGTMATVVEKEMLRQKEKEKEKDNHLGGGNAVGIGRSKSKKGKDKDKDKKRMRSKSRDPMEGKKAKDEGRPDRECVVM